MGVVSATVRSGLSNGEGSSEDASTFTAGPSHLGVHAQVFIGERSYFDVFVRIGVQNSG